jgi:prolyl oligopeptidase
MKPRLSVAWLLLCYVTSVCAVDKPKEVHGDNGVTLPPPPTTEAKPVMESIDGVALTDPYRWLEDDHSSATRDWIAAQMRYTQDYLAHLKIRPEIVKRLTELLRVESFTIPEERDGKYFFSKRLP